MDRVRRDGLRVLGVELGPTHSDKDDGVAVASDTENTFHVNMLFGFQVSEPPLELLDDRFDAGRVFCSR